MSRLTAGFLLLAMFTTASLSADAQLSPLGAARVTLLAGPSLSKGARTEVWRRAEGVPQNVVIVDWNAGADDLAGALAMINALRMQHGDALTQDYRAWPEMVKHGPSWKDSAYRKWLHDQLMRLRQAPQQAFADFGIVRAVHITLPARGGVISSANSVTK